MPVALLVAVAAVGALRLGARVDRLADKRQLAVLLGSGVLLAVLAIGVNAITGEPVSTVLFSGQAAIGTALGITSAATLVLIAVAKALAYGISLGGGYRGGLVFPAVYLGVVVASLTANGLGLGNVAALAAAGMAAGVAATVRLPFTAVLLAVLLGAGAGLAITTPAIVGAAVGLLLPDRCRRRGGAVGRQQAALRTVDPPPRSHPRTDQRRARGLTGRPWGLDMPWARGREFAGLCAWG